MAIHKAFEAALKAISYNKLSVKASYQLKRKLGELGKFDLLRPTLKVTDTEVVCAGRTIPVRVFYPNNETDDNDLILFFHGGGWVTGDIDSYNRICAVAARNTGCKVASVDYRLAPEHPFPAGLMDCYEVAKHLFRNSRLIFGIDPDRITLMGDSAGGNLAAAVSLMARDKKEFYPKRQILFYPSTYSDHTDASPYPSIRENGTDFVLTSKNIQDYMDLYLRNPEDKTNPYFAMLLASDFSNQPDTLVITAEFDPLRDEGEDYAQHLKNAGNRVECYRMMDSIHGFLSLPAGTMPVKKSYEIINKFLDEVQIDRKNTKKDTNEKAYGLDKA